MNFLSSVLILIMIASPTSRANAETCKTWLKAFAIYEDMINRKIVLKHSLYPLGEWEPNSRYDGILLVKSVPGTATPVLEVEYRSVLRDARRVETFKVLRPFEGNSALKQFDDFKPQEFFTFDQAGTYFVRLRANGRIVCEDNFPYRLGD